MSTSGKYDGLDAKLYEERRRGQAEWSAENRAVEALLGPALAGMDRPEILDLPVGTGRFAYLYEAMGARVTGVDASMDMLAEAAAKGLEWSWLVRGDVTAGALPFRDRSFDASVCVRLLNFFSRKEAHLAIHELCRCTRWTVVIQGCFAQKERDLPEAHLVHSLPLLNHLLIHRGFEICDMQDTAGPGWKVLVARRV